MTAPAAETWPATDGGFRRFETSRLIRAPAESWQRASDDLLRWRIKTRSGFAVIPDEIVAPGARPLIVARVLGIVIREPVEVVDVVRGDDRVGFAYRTLPGHPVDGEEAFILWKTPAGVELTIRSLTRASRSPLWRGAYPLLRVAQWVARRRYLRALDERPLAASRNGAGR